MLSYEKIMLFMIQKLAQNFFGNLLEVVTCEWGSHWHFPNFGKGQFWFSSWYIFSMALIQCNVKGCNSNFSLIHCWYLVLIFKRNEEVVNFTIPYKHQIQWLFSMRIWVKETSTPWMRYLRRLILFWDNNIPMKHSLAGIKGKENMFAYKNHKDILGKGIFNFYLCSSPTPFSCFHWSCLVIFRVI